MRHFKELFWVLSGDDAGVSGGGESAAPVSSPSSAPSPAASTPSPMSAGGVTTVSAADSPAQVLSGQSSPQPTTQTVRDALASYGLDVRTQFQDDHQALQYLASQYRNAAQAQEMARYGQLYVQHAAEFQNYLQERQRQAQQAQQQQQPSWWKAPEYDPTWAQKLTRDPVTGEIKAIPGADPTLPQKFTSWLEHQRSFLDKFAQDPISAIRPGIEQVVQETAAKMMQQQFGQYQERNAASDFVRSNSEWLYDRDQSGRPMIGQNGQPQLSPMGQRFAGYVLEAERMGIYDVSSQQRYALGLVQRDALAAMTQQQQQQVQQQGQIPQQPMAPGEAEKQAFLQRAASNAPSQPAPPPGNTNGTVRPGGAGARELREMLSRAMKANGYAAGQEII